MVWERPYGCRKPSKGGAVQSDDAVREGDVCVRCADDTGADGIECRGKNALSTRAMMSTDRRLLAT